MHHIQELMKVSEIIYKPILGINLLFSSLGC